MNSTLVRLVRYEGIFGKIEWLKQDEAEAKLATEKKLYERWKYLDSNEIHEPRIPGSTHN